MGAGGASEWYWQFQDPMGVPPQREEEDPSVSEFWLRHWDTATGFSWCDSYVTNITKVMQLLKVESKMERLSTLK